MGENENKSISRDLFAAYKNPNTNALLTSSFLYELTDFDNNLRVRIVGKINSCVYLIRVRIVFIDSCRFSSCFSMHVSFPYACGFEMSVCRALALRVVTACAVWFVHFRKSRRRFTRRSRKTFVRKSNTDGNDRKAYRTCLFVIVFYFIFPYSINYVTSYRVASDGTPRIRLFCRPAPASRRRPSFSATGVVNGSRFCTAIISEPPARNKR